MIQPESFPFERQQLDQEKPINRKNRIAFYSPFIGPDDLRRSTGRFRRFAGIDFHQKRPRIHDGHHPSVVLFLRHMHLKHHIDSVDYLHALMQQRIAVLKLFSTLCSKRFSCALCRKKKATPVQHMMANLPSERLGFQSPPFTNVSLDYFGLFYATIRRSSEKRWGFLFKCLRLVPSLLR